MFNDVIITFCLFINMVSVLYKLCSECLSSFATKFSNPFSLCLKVVFDGKMSLSITFLFTRGSRSVFAFWIWISFPNLAPIANVLSTSFPIGNQQNVFGFWKKSSPLFIGMIAIQTQCCNLSFPSNYV